MRFVTVVLHSVICVAQSMFYGLGAVVCVW